MSKLEVPGNGLKVGGRGLLKLVEIEAKIEIKQPLEKKEGRVALPPLLSGLWN